MKLSKPNKLKVSILLYLLSMTLLSFGQTIDYNGVYHQVNTPSGFIRLGPNNTSWAHIYTDRPKFIFDKPVYLHGGILSAYSNKNLTLQTDGTTRMTVLKSNGNVGIGATSPSAKLEVRGTSNTVKIWKGSGYSPIQFYSSGDGSHNNSPVSIWSYGYGGSQDLNFKVQNWGGNYYYQFGASGGTYKAFRITKGGGGGNGPNDGYGIAVVYGKTQSNGIRLAGYGDSYFNGGNVGIGTSTPDAKLTVNGTIHSKEVKVNLTGWPDYVFSKNYKLNSLQETESFIKEEGHLPNIPSANEVKQNGINLGEMNAKLLEKIEELTLHLIDQNKRMEKMQQEINELKK